MKINRIILYFESKDGRHHGFRITRCRDGRSVEGHVSGGESNITMALTNDGNDWQRDYYRTSKVARESEIFALPYAGCRPEDIREFVAKEFRKRIKKD